MYADLNALHFQSMDAKIKEVVQCVWGMWCVWDVVCVGMWCVWGCGVCGDVVCVGMWCVGDVGCGGRCREMCVGGCGMWGCAYPAQCKEENININSNIKLNASL